MIRYDRNWNKTGTAHITGIAGDEFGQVRYPFDGCVEMTELNGILYIATGHEGYVDASLGQGHQGLLVIAVDQQTMTGEIIDNDLWHSFAQYVKVRDNQLYLLEQSEGSRCTTLSRYDTAAKQWKRISVYQYGGNRTSSWAASLLCQRRCTWKFRIHLFLVWEPPLIRQSMTRQEKIIFP